MRQNVKAGYYGNNIITRSMQIKAKLVAEQNGINVDTLS